MGVILNNVIGFSLFGLAVRCWQLGLTNSPLFVRNKLWVHGTYMVAFGGIGYGVVKLEDRVNLRLAELRALRARAKVVEQAKLDKWGFKDPEDAVKKLSQMRAERESH